MRRLIAGLLLVGLLSACGRSCVYRPGGTSRDDEIEDLISASPECQEVRSRYDSCGMSGIFDAKLFCGPDTSKGDCVASARARVKCRLEAKEGYACSGVGGTKMFTGQTPSSCADFASLCTGADKNTIPYGADGGDIKRK